MNFNRFYPGCVIAGLLLLSVGTGRAHDPYDHSAQLFVGGTRLELVVAMGGDAARDFLAGTDLPAAQREGLVTSSSSTPRALPVEVAARLFAITADDQPLRAQTLTVFVEGLDTIFTATYPRPAAGRLELHALYFNGIEPMKRGGFTALDENMNALGSAFLSRADNAAQIQLPAVNLPPLAAGAITGRAVAAGTATTSPPAGGGFRLMPFVIAAIVLGLFALFGWSRRARHGASTVLKPGKDL